MRNLLHFLFWFVYFPLLRLLVLFLFWSSKVEGRERFEKKNKFEYLALSFKDQGLQADICFEFSSEGEYQQVAPLIEDALYAGKRIELVFFSPSVEKTIMKLAAAYPKQIRYLRYPLVRLFPFIHRRSFTHWITAKTLILVRYDLFPEFLLWGMKKDHDLKMVWVSFKKERSQGKKISFWKKWFLSQAKDIIYAGRADQEEGEKLSFPGKVFDFRLEQIHRRIEHREEKLMSQFPLWPEFKDLLYRYPFEKRLILGNAWPSDLFLIKNLPPEFLVVVVPHKLTPEILATFHDGLEKLGRGPLLVSDSASGLSSSGTILLNKKGILCELYSDFAFSYVGGGFEGSIHSVLEPLGAHSPFLACGPAHHRSTEFDIAREEGRITEVNTPEQFSDWILGSTNKEVHDKISSVHSSYVQMRELVLSC